MILLAFTLCKFNNVEHISRSYLINNYEELDTNRSSSKDSFGAKETTVEIGLRLLSVYEIDAQENGTHLNISGQIDYKSNDPRMCKIMLGVTCELPSSNSPKVIYASGTGIYPFTVGITVPKLKEDLSVPIQVEGSYTYLLGSPIYYSIDPFSGSLTFKVNNFEEPHLNSTNEKDGSTPGFNVLSIIIILSMIIFMTRMYRKSIKK